MIEFDQQDPKARELALDQAWQIACALVRIGRANPVRFQAALEDPAGGSLRQVALDAWRLFRLLHRIRYGGPSQWDKQS